MVAVGERGLRADAQHARLLLLQQVLVTILQELLVCSPPGRTGQLTNAGQTDALSFQPPAARLHASLPLPGYMHGRYTSVLAPTQQWHEARAGLR